MITPGYRTVIFDCDGVLLNSNPVKCEAMLEAAQPWGNDAAHALVTYHREHGGISRDIKFEYFFETILGRSDDYRDEFKELKKRYGTRVETRLRACEIAPRLPTLLDGLKKSGITMFVASGADQDELRNILSGRGLSHFFQGIFGAPISKIDHLRREIASGSMRPPRLFFGDSVYDWEAALATACDFVFVADWSEVKEGADYFHNKGVTVIDNLGSLLVRPPVMMPTKETGR